VKRVLLAVLVAVGAAVLSSAADASVCIFLVHDVRSCVATAPDEPVAVPVSGRSEGGASASDDAATAPVSGESGVGATS
jgi:hypothetical protein